MKRVVILIIIAAMVLSVAACVNNPDDNGESDNGKETTASATQAVDTKPSEEDILGFPEEDNDKKTFTILLNNSAGFFDLSTDFYAETDTGNRVVGETFERNGACEDYLGISLNYILEPGNYNSGMADKVYKEVLSNDTSSYDMVVMGLNTGIMSGYVDCFYDVSYMEGINLEHDWWIDEMIDAASVNGKMVFLAGDSCISLYGYIGCVFANLGLSETFQLNTDYYQLVRDKKWTMEKFLTLSKSVRQDTAGDDIIQSEVDKFGWANCSTGVRVLWSSCDMQLIERASDGKYAWKSELDNKMIDFIEDLQEANSRDNSFYFGNPDLGALDAFVEERCLFLTYYVYLAQQMTEMKNGYVILPMPMYNEEQEDYISTNISAFNALFFPSNIASPALSAKVAEYMGWYGKENIIPAYYDVTLKYQYNNVEDNIAMLDLIRDKLRISPNELFGTLGNGIGLTAMTVANTATDGFYSLPVSVWKTKYPALEEKLKTYMSMYD